MTEPKKEKCEACYGSGYINFRTDDGHISMRTCRRCNGYEYINVEPLTNEEWLRSCNTEQLAEVLWERINGAFNSGYACCNLKQDKDYVGRYKRFKEWLKQTHTDRE